MSSTARILLAVTAMIILVMLVVGLSPRGFDGNNGVRWQADSAGIHFQRGIGYTKSLLRQRELADGGGHWTWQVTLEAQPRNEAGFGVAAVLYSGSDDAQIQLAQWRRTLVVMAGDDYPNLLRQPRLTYELADADDALQVTVTHGPDGAALYVNDAPVSRAPRPTWPVLAAPGRLRLVVGSTVSGQYPWQGTLYSMALYDQTLPPTAIHDRQPVFAYDFGAVRERRIASTGTVSGDLVFPDAYSAPELRPLAWPRHWRPLARGTVIDIVVNLVGFLPLGFCAAWLLYATGRALVVSMVLAVAIGAGLSLVIEIAQVWLPGRDSSLLDLVVNVVGAALGAVAFAFRPRSPRTYVADG
ncbi:MAG: VanZ family protein [Pseudomonadales bacterium]